MGIECCAVCVADQRGPSQASMPSDSHDVPDRMKELLECGGQLDTTCHVFHVLRFLRSADALPVLLSPGSPLDVRCVV